LRGAQTLRWPRPRAPESRPWVRPREQNVPGKISEASPSGCSQSDPNADQPPGGVITSANLLVPVLV